MAPPETPHYSGRRDIIDTLMATAWVNSVKDTKTLKVFNRLSGKWVNIFSLAITEFNGLSRRYGLGVKLVKAGGESDANIVMEVASGEASFEYGGEKATASFGEDAVHGRTSLFEGADGIEKAVIFLPGDIGDLNTKMLEVIAVHEFIHGCGLSNADHGTDGVFYSPLVKSNGKMIVPEKGKNKRPMPPIFLSPGTVSKIQGIW